PYPSTSHSVHAFQRWGHRDPFRPASTLGRTGGSPPTSQVGRLRRLTVDLALGTRVPAVAGRPTSARPQSGLVRVRGAPNTRATPRSTYMRSSPHDPHRRHLGLPPAPVVSPVPGSSLLPRVCQTSNLVGSPAPTRIISGSPWEKSITVV